MFEAIDVLLKVIQVVIVIALAIGFLVLVGCAMTAVPHRSKDVEPMELMEPFDHRVAIRSKKESDAKDQETIDRATEYYNDLNG